MKVQVLYGESASSMSVEMTTMSEKGRAPYMRKRRKDNPELREKERKYLRAWRKRNPDKMRKYRSKDKEKNKRQSAEYRKRHPEKIKVQRHARYLPLDNECAQCGTTETLRHHHPDYSRPDYTITLCKQCHTELHRRRGRYEVAI